MNPVGSCKSRPLQRDVTGHTMVPMPPMSCLNSTRVEKGIDVPSQYAHLEAMQDGDVNFDDDLIDPKRRCLQRVKTHTHGDLLRHVVAARDGSVLI